MVKIYTRSGDEGTTSLLGGSRVSKADLRVEAYGTVDELNALLGVVSAHLEHESIQEIMEEIQSLLFVCGAQLAAEQREDTPDAGPMGENVTAPDVEQVEQWIDQYEEELPQLQNFILPGGGEVASYLHLARSVCRRAERTAVTLQEEGQDLDQVIPFLNRLSDLFFVLARYMNQEAGISETNWSSFD